MRCYRFSRFTALLRAQRSLAMVVVAALVAIVVSCGGDAEADSGIRVISPESANDILFENPPEDLVVLDVRTPDEFELLGTRR